jgi:hypothetical protein
LKFCQQKEKKRNKIFFLLPLVVDADGFDEPVLALGRSNKAIVDELKNIM